jgi:hypothetical protein
VGREELGLGEPKEILPGPKTFQVSALVPLGPLLPLIAPPRRVKAAPSATATPPTTFVAMLPEMEPPSRKRVLGFNTKFL